MTLKNKVNEEGVSEGVQWRKEIRLFHQDCSVPWEQGLCMSRGHNRKFAKGWKIDIGRGVGEAVMISCEPTGFHDHIGLWIYRE